MSDSPGGSISLVVRDGGETWITLERRDKHNALSRSLLAELANAVSAAAADAATRFIVVRGAGERYFAAGGDIVDLADVRTPQQTEAMALELTAALDALRRCAVPVVAYVNGDALGGGAELAVACDMRVAATHARIGFIHGRLAITPAWGGATDLVNLVGPSRALRLMARSELVEAQPALDMGLVDAIAHDGAQGTAITAFLEPLRETPPRVLRAMKAQVAATKRSAIYRDHQAIERRHFIKTWVDADHWKAVERFLARGDKS